MLLIEHISTIYYSTQALKKTENFKGMMTYLDQQLNIISLRDSDKGKYHGSINRIPLPES